MCPVLLLPTRDPDHEEFRVKDPGKVQEHNLSIVGGVRFGSVAQSCRLFATPWGGQALHKMRVWSPSEPQPTAFRVHFFPFGGVSFHNKPKTPAPFWVPRIHSDPAARRENQGGLCPRCDWQ